MKRRILAVAVLSVLLLNLGGSVSADVTKKGAARSQATQLAMLLPASDGVVTLDVRRFFDVALPRLLSANQLMLNSIVTKLDEMKAKTGIDFRQFDALAAGVTLKKSAANKFDADPVVIARGQISSSALIGAAKLASNGKYREVKAGEKTIYVFAAKDIADQVNKQNPAPKQAASVDKVLGHLSGEMAVSIIDANTLVFGSLPLVQSTLAAKTKVGTDLISLLGKRETAVVSFAAKMPTGARAFLPLDNDELGKNIDSIRFVYGNMDVTADAATVNLTARTLQNAQAAALLQSLEGLQLVGKALLGGSKSADKQVYARMIENAKLSVAGNELMFDLTVPQADIDVVVSSLK